MTAATNAASISVVIPAYNASSLIGATLASIAEQSLKPVEVIVVDDGSKDSTAEIARSFGATVISLANRGPAAARNAGIVAAKGEYIALMDADDLWPREKLEVQFAALKAFGRPAFSFTDYRMFDDRGMYRRRSELRRRAAFRSRTRRIPGSSNLLLAAGGDEPVLSDSYIHPSTVLVRREDALALGCFDENLLISEDYDFFLRLLHLVPAVVVMKTLLFYRQHAGQATSKTVLYKAGFFGVAELVAANPQRYPPADVRFFAGTEFLRHYRVGMTQARLGQLSQAIASFEKSRASRWTARTDLMLGAARFAQSAPGRLIFTSIRSSWKRRPKWRSASRNEQTRK